MLTQILILIIGLALVVVGAEILVRGASCIAKKAGISEFVIGMTIVGMGTSAPEMVVSFLGAIQGNADISIGNVIGSNIMNTLLIIGLTALILPIAISPDNKKTDIPFNIFTVLILFILGMNHTVFGLGNNVLSRIDGIALLVLFILFMVYSFRKGMNSPSVSENSEEEAKDYGTGLSILMIVGGLGGLILGGNMFVNSATAIAKVLGISDKFIAITILAGGTSLPELATCIVAALKKKGDLALGNIIGSNIFNIMLILGGSAIICPLSFSSINYVDFGILFLSSVLLLLSAFTGKNNKIDRFDGILFLICELAYMFSLIKNL